MNHVLSGDPVIETLETFAVATVMFNSVYGS